MKRRYPRKRDKRISRRQFNPMSFQAWKFFLISFVVSFAIHDWLILAQSLEGLVDRQSTLLPLVWVLGITLICRSIFSTPPLWLKIVLSLGASMLNLRYLYWRFTSTLILDWYNGPVSIAVILMEVIAIINVTLINYQTLFLTNHSREVDERSPKVKNGEFVPSVDIFIPTYNEPIDVLRRTLVGCNAIHYPNKKVWLLDDGKRLTAAELAQELGCEYLTRPDGSHAKAGNLNNGLKHAKGDIVVVFDADFIPLNHFLERTIPLFQNPQVAMVVTPQNFYNPDPPEINLGGRILPHEQTTFYSIIQSGRDLTNSAICTGTSTVIRRKHLDIIGGVPINTIVEDWVTGIHLQARGYRTIYFNEMLSVGAAPENLGAYLVQRIRWGEGTLKTFFSEHSPLKVPGLNLIQRINHASGALYWIDQATQSVGYISPALFILFGMRSMEVSIPEIIYYWVPNYVAGLIGVSWVVGSRTILVSYVYNALQCFHLVPMVFNTLTRPNAKVKFKVTPKGVTQSRSELDFKLMSSVLILFAINLGLFILGTLRSATSLDSDRYIINVLWTGWNSMVLGLTIIAGIDVIEERSSIRIDCSQSCNLVIANEAETCFQSPMVNISEGGVAFLNTQTIRLEIGQVLKFSIPGETLQLTAEVVRVGAVVGCRFLDVTEQRQLELIEYIYCRPNRWDRPQVAREGRALKSLFLSLFDLYPLQRLR